MISLNKKTVGITIIQILGTVGILALVPHSLLQLVLLLLFWQLTFGKMSAQEYFIFFVASVALTISQVTTPLSHLFYFSTTDFYTIPWYECVMWGFYSLSAFRLFGGQKHFAWTSVLLMIVFGGVFLLFSTTHWSLLLASAIALALLFLHAHTRLDFVYAVYFIFLAMVIETSGGLSSLWVYPNIASAPNLFGIAPLWSICFWVGSGVLIGKIIMPLSYKLLGKKSVKR